MVAPEKLQIWWLPTSSWGVANVVEMASQLQGHCWISQECGSLKGFLRTRDFLQHGIARSRYSHLNIWGARSDANGNISSRGKGSKQITAEMAGIRICEEIPQTENWFPRRTKPSSPWAVCEALATEAKPATATLPVKTSPATPRMASSGVASMFRKFKAALVQFTAALARTWGVPALWSTIWAEVSMPVQHQLAKCSQFWNHGSQPPSPTRLLARLKTASGSDGRKTSS